LGFETGVFFVFGPPDEMPFAGETISARLENSGEGKCAILHRRRLALVPRMFIAAGCCHFIALRQSGGAVLAVNVRKDFHAGH
jgi:hypothetical protein